MHPPTAAQKQHSENYKKLTDFATSIIEQKNLLNQKLSNDLLLVCECEGDIFQISATWTVGNVPLFEINMYVQDLEIHRYTVWPNRQPIIGYNEVKSILFSESIRHGLYNIQRSMLHLEL